MDFSLMIRDYNFVALFVIVWCVVIAIFGFGLFVFKFIVCLKTLFVSDPEKNDRDKKREQRRAYFREAGLNANACSNCGRLYSEIDSCTLCRTEKLSDFAGYVHRYSAECVCPYCVERKRRLS